MTNAPSDISIGDTSDISISAPDPWQLSGAFQATQCVRGDFGAESVASRPRCFSAQACDFHRAMSVGKDHMVSGLMASDLDGGQFGGDTTLYGMARV
jgi:hypothetical protein